MEKGHGGLTIRYRRKLNFVLLLILEITVVVSLIVQASSAQSGTILFEDFFGYPDDTRPANWNAYSGNWVVLGGEYHQTADTAWARTFTGQSSWSNYSVQVTARGVETFLRQEPPVFGILFRVQDPLNFYWFWASVDKVQIGRMVQGQQTYLATRRYLLSATGSYILKVEVQGSVIKAYVDGVLQLQTNDATFPNGRIGLGTYHFHAAFDDVTVETLSPLPPLTTGTLSVDTNPVKGQVLVNGTNWGIAPQTREITAGIYVVSFGNISRYITPAPQIVLVEVGQTASVLATYEFSSAGILFEDFFDYPNETRPANWNAYSGNWIVLDGEYHQTADSAWARTFTGQSSWSNYSVQVTARGVQTFPPQEPPVSAILFRVQDPLNFYWFWVDIDKIQIAKMVQGQQTYLATKGYTLSPTGTYTLRVEVEGNVITAYVDSVQQLQVTDSTFLTGMIGLGTYHFHPAFDNVTVENLAPVTTGTLRVDTSPVKGDVFVNGTSWGIAPQSRETEPGAYNVSFGEVSGFITPEPQTVQVEIGRTTNVMGLYSSNGSFTLILEVPTDQDDASVANWGGGGMFMNYIGYEFNMITRGDIPVAIRGGYRFVGAAIPQGSNIQSAKLRLRLQMSRYLLTDPDEPLPPGHTVFMFAQATGDAPAFILNAAEFMARPGTTANITWNLPEGTVVGEWMEVDITSVLQEVVDRSDWAEGNAIAIFTEYTTGNSAYYLVHSFGAATPYPGQLEITYQASP